MSFLQANKHKIDNADQQCDLLRLAPLSVFAVCVCVWVCGVVQCGCVVWLVWYSVGGCGMVQCGCVWYSVSVGDSAAPLALLRGLPSVISLCLLIQPTT